MADVLVDRATWIKKLLQLLRNVGGSKYFVKRGPIQWDTFTWPKNFAVAVRAAENFPADTTELRTTTLELIVGAKINQETEEADDEVLDMMEDEMLTVMLALVQAKDDSGKCSLTVKSDHLGSVELNGSAFGMQGWFITFKVEY